MARVPVLLAGLVFTALVGALTLRDLVVHGPTVTGVAGALVVILFAIALVGALLHPPEK
jgi:hypothetical protein